MRPSVSQASYTEDLKNEPHPAVSQKDWDFYEAKGHVGTIPT